HLEPRTPENVAAVGYDMLSDPVRREAMMAARDRGEARLSAPVALVQDEGAATPRRGVLMYAPVYRAGDHPASRAARRLSHQGWVYIPLRLEPMVQAALDPRRGNLRLEIRDVTNGEEALLYADPPIEGKPEFRMARGVHVYGRDWKLSFESRP